MKILLIADEESKRYWDYYQPGLLDGVDLILSAGDLNPHYLQFLVTMSRAELVYVHGNHDKRYQQDPPLGCICADDTIVKVKGLRILGLGGSMRYNLGPYQYTEKQMVGRRRKLRRKLRKNKGFDILLTHAPAKGLNDGDDLPHQGFEVFRDLISEYHPRLFVHGHIHPGYGKGYKRKDEYQGTPVYNACGVQEIELPEL